MRLTQEMGLKTQCVHSATKPNKETGAVTTPIYASTTFAFENIEDAAAKFSGAKEGYIYTRFGNPTVRALEKKIATLHRADDARAFGSGMAAISACVLSIVKAGDHIVSTDQLYGGTDKLFRQILSQLGIELSFVDTSNPTNVLNAIKKNTKLVHIETPANPTMKLADIKEISAIAHDKDIPVAVDNSFMSAFNQRPIKLGADICIESLGKYFSGHLDVLGGLVAGSKTHIEKVYDILKCMGGVLSPFDAWIILRGIKSLPFRMEQHNKNGLALAEFLEKHPKIKKVYYPGLKSHPQYDLAKRQMDSFGAMLSFEVKGGFDKARKLMESVKLCTLAVSFGGDKTLIQHPASMTHVMVPREIRLKMGLTDGLVRFSAGIEDAEDIIADLNQALSSL